MPRAIKKTEVVYEDCLDLKAEDLMPAVTSFFEDSGTGAEDFLVPETLEQAEDWYEKSMRMWKGMPEFKDTVFEPYNFVQVNFATKEDQEAFEKLVGQNCPPKRKKIWYPKKVNRSEIDQFWEDDSQIGKPNDYRLALAGQNK